MTEGGNGRWGREGPTGHLDPPQHRWPWWTVSCCPQPPHQPGYSNRLWVIIIISPRGIAGPPDQRGTRVLQNVLCFIAFKSLIGQRRGATMIRKPVMWKMKDLAYKTERWRRGNNKIHDKCRARLDVVFKPSRLPKHIRTKNKSADRK